MINPSDFLHLGQKITKRQLPLKYIHPHMLPPDNDKYLQG